MKLRFSILMVLIMAMSVMAEQTNGEVVELLKALALLAFLTPIGWGILVLLIIGLCQWIGKETKVVVTTNYSKISEEDKRETLLKELESDA